MQASISFEITAKGDWVPAIASALFIAAKKGLFTFTTPQLRMVLAVATLSLPLCNSLVRTQHYDLVSSSLAPAALAAEALKILGAVPAAVVAFGTSLCGSLAGMLRIQGVYYLLLLSLAAAVYCSRASVWFCAAWMLLTGSQFFSGVQQGRVLVIPGIFSACLLYALYDFISAKSLGLVTDITLCIVAAQVVWSIFQTSKRFANDAT